MDQKESGFTINTITDEQVVPAIEWVAEQMPGGFFVYKADDSQEIVYVNQATYRLFGCDNAEEFCELTGNTFYGLVHPEDFPSIQASIDEQIADAANKNMDYVEYRIIRRDGSIRWVDDYGHYAHLPGYGDVYYVFIGDITEKHLAMEENRRRANIYGGLLSQFNAFADDSLTMMRMNLTSGLIEEVRGRDCYKEDRAGTLIEESILLRAENFLIEGDRLRYEKYFLPKHTMERYRKGSESASFVAYCHRPSGKQSFVKFSGSVATDPQTGDLIALYAETEYNTEQVTDVLGRKVLARQYDMVSYIIGAHYGVVIGDAENIRKGNIFPKERDGNYSEYITGQVLPVVDGDEENRLRIEKALSLKEIRRRLLKEESYAVEVNCRIDGELYYKRFSYYPVDREMSFYILLKEDLTEVIRKEREQNDRLADALKEAEEANRAKSDFLSNMSHEIRTPITAILGMNELIRRESKNETVLGYAENINAAGMSLLGIISDILDFSKIEAGHMELVEAAYSPAELIGNLVNLTRFKADEKGLLLKVEADPALPGRLLGDELRLKQVITNLLTNAVKYTEKGSVTLSVRKKEIKEDRVVLTVSVEDTGIGIKEEERQKLFSAFDRLDVIRTRTIEGTGLGLAITVKLLDLMGSGLSVESTYNEGSVFSFNLTQKILDETPIGEIDPFQAGRSDRTGRHRMAGFTAKGAKVLVVDDTPMNLQVISGLLKHTEMSVQTAASGYECIESFEAGDRYDLVFLDYRMPGMDGIETLQILSQRFPEILKKTPVICLTASALSGDREKMLAAGFSDYLSKPVNIHDMEMMIKKYLGDRIVVKPEQPETQTTEDPEEEELGKLPGQLFHISRLDLASGLEFCGDAEDYLAALSVFAGSIGSKSAAIEEAFQKEDTDNYITLVHSLKSTARAVGAKELADLALLLEQAGRNRELAVIQERTGELLLAYRALAGELAFLDQPEI